MSAVFLNAVGVVSALGLGVESLSRTMSASEPCGVLPTDRHTPGLTLHLGCVDAELPSLDHLPVAMRSRSNALFAVAMAGLRPAVDAARSRYGPSRLAVIVGVSTAGLHEGEVAARRRLAHQQWPDGYDYAQQEMGSAAAFVARESGAQGPRYAISTACSSGAKALASAARLLRAGMVDAVIVGGGDALCGFTIAGFGALESVSAQRCNPMSANRCGINIGEGAALFLVTRDAGPVRLAGWGETSDAHHMSAPDPAGKGAADAMALALQRAGMSAGGVDYVNLHGTATPHNDAMESRAVASVLGLDVNVSSTKPLTGHALAAAGAIEAAIAWRTLVENPQGRLPVHWWDGQSDPTLAPLALVRPGSALGRPVRSVLSNSFAFGGSNASLLFAAE